MREENPVGINQWLEQEEAEYYADEEAE